MRNTLLNISSYGAAVVTTLALNVQDAFAAGDAHGELHAESITILENGKAVVEHGVKDAHGDAHGGGHYPEVEGLPQLDFTTYSSQIFWMFAGFIILYIFFAKKTLPEIAGAVETRRDKIEGDLDNAKDLKDQADKAQAEYEAALQDARLKASETFKSAETQIKAENNAKLEAFKDRANKLTQDTEGKIVKAKDKAMGETQSVAAEIASIAAEKIVGIPTDIKQAETTVKNINKKAA